MLYKFLKHVAGAILKTADGHIIIKNRQLLPKGNYVLIAPHRTWFDPVVYAYACYPKEFGFMAKKELFKNSLYHYILKRTHGISVDRQHPGISVITKPVRVLRGGHVSIIMFPSGTRHSQKLKSGAALIAKLADVPLVPAVYQGPLTFKTLFSRKPIHISFGHPIYIPHNFKLNNHGQKQIEIKMNQVFTKLDKSINPDFHYVDVSKK